MVQKVITRTLVQQSIDFVCQRCGKPSTRLQYSGPTPRYCLDCLPQVRKENAARRQARRRAKLKAQSK